MTPEGKAKEALFMRGFNHYGDQTSKALQKVKTHLTEFEESFVDGVEPPGLRHEGEELLDAVVRLVAALRHMDMFYMDYAHLLYDVREEKRRDGQQSQSE